MAGFRELIPDLAPEQLELVHGTTVGTNAFLERKGARTVLITTKGFEDVLWIGRQARPELYNLDVRKPPEIIPRENVLGLDERMDSQGLSVKKITQEEIGRAERFCEERDAQSVAVCFLHAYANQVHEQQVANALSGRRHVSFSSGTLPEFREFERFSTTLINAYLGPVLGRYIDNLCSSLPGAGIFVQQSNGGCIPAEGAGTHAVHTLLSGPAGGVQAAWDLARDHGVQGIITLDMGGTSTDVSLCRGGLSYTRDYQIQGYPVAVPMLDIHTVGAGGGSVAWIDSGGLLRVGPQSAGADPGPVCYGRGGSLTVTDANLFLGRLIPDFFLAGRMKIYPERIRPKLEKLGLRLGLSAEEAALGILKLVNTNMTQAIRTVSLEKGHDPRKFALVCFGGAAGLHAADLAGELDVPRIIIPSMAGVFSAQGMAEADLVMDRSMAFICNNAGDRHSEIRAALSGLTEKMTEDMRESGLEPDMAVLEPAIDARYQGQSYELTIPWADDWPAIFEAEHRRLYGYSLPENVLEVTALRIRARICRKLSLGCGMNGEECIPDGGRGRIPDMTTKKGHMHLAQETVVMFEDGPSTVPLALRKDFAYGENRKGPVLIIDDFTTVLVPVGWTASAAENALVMERS